MKVIHNISKSNLDTSKKIYTCSNCNELFNWSDQSLWFGSYKDLENNPNRIIYCCSDKCRIELGDNPKPKIVR